LNQITLPPDSTLLNTASHLIRSVMLYTAFWGIATMKE